LKTKENKWKIQYMYVLLSKRI